MKATASRETAFKILGACALRDGHLEGMVRALAAALARHEHLGPVLADLSAACECLVRRLWQAGGASLGTCRQ